MLPLSEISWDTAKSMLQNDTHFIFLQENHLFGQLFALHSQVSTNRHCRGANKVYKYRKIDKTNQMVA